MITKEINKNVKKITFIYSGHGREKGLSINNEVLEYKSLMSSLIKDLSIARECNVN